MKIHMTKKDYKILLHMLYMADWMIFSHSTDPGEDMKPYRQLEQKLLSYAKDYGCEDLVEYVKSLQEYMPTRKLEDDEQLRKAIGDFEENTFWTELCDRLAERDMSKKFGNERMQEMEPVEFFEKQGEIVHQYVDEFRENGLANLVIKK